MTVHFRGKNVIIFLPDVASAARTSDTESPPT